MKKEKTFDSISKKESEDEIFNEQDLSMCNSEKNSNFNLGRWQPEEHQRFIQAMFLYGNEWRKVQEYIGTRSSTQARSHAQKFFIRLKKRFSNENFPDIESIQRKSEKILNWIREYIPPEVTKNACEDSSRKFMKVIMNLMAPQNETKSRYKDENEISKDKFNPFSENYSPSYQNINLFNQNDSGSDNLFGSKSFYNCEQENSYSYKCPDDLKNLILDLDPSREFRVNKEQKIRIPLKNSTNNFVKENRIFKIVKDLKRKKRRMKKSQNHSKILQPISSVLSYVSRDTYKKDDFDDLEEFFKINPKVHNETCEVKEKKNFFVKDPCKDSTSNYNSSVNTQYFNPNHQNYINIVNINFEKPAIDGNSINNFNNFVAGNFNQKNYEKNDENTNINNKINLNYSNNASNQIGNNFSMINKENSNNNKNINYNNILNPNIFSNFNNLNKTGQNNMSTNSNNNNHPHLFSNCNLANNNVNYNNYGYNTSIGSNMNMHNYSNENPQDFGQSNSSATGTNYLSKILQELNELSRCTHPDDFAKLQRYVKTFLDICKLKNSNSSNNSSLLKIMNNLNLLANLNTPFNTSNNCNFYKNENNLPGTNIPNPTDPSMSNRKNKNNYKTMKSIHNDKEDVKFYYDNINSTNPFINGGNINLINNSELNEIKIEPSPTPLSKINQNKDLLELDSVFQSQREVNFDIDEDNMCNNFYLSNPAEQPKTDTLDFNLDEYFNNT